MGQEVEQHQQSNVVEKANKVQRDKDKLKRLPDEHKGWEDSR